MSKLRSILGVASLGGLAFDALAQQAQQCNSSAQSIGGMVCNAANQAITVADVLPMALCYLFGSISLVWGGYALSQYAKHKGRDPGQNTPGKAFLLLCAAAALLYAPTWLNIGVTSVTNGVQVQAVIK